MWSKLYYLLAAQLHVSLTKVRPLFMLFSHSIFNLGYRGDALNASAPEIGVHFQRFGALAPFPKVLPPRIRWGLIGTLLVWAPGALIGADHFPIQ